MIPPSTEPIMSSGRVLRRQGLNAEAPFQDGNGKAARVKKTDSGWVLFLAKTGKTGIFSMKIVFL